MSPEQFAYWLNGFAELSTEPPTAEQWQSIKEHLALVFNKVTPPAPGNTPPAPGNTPPAVLPSIFDQIRKRDDSRWTNQPPGFGYPQVVC